MARIAHAIVALFFLFMAAIQLNDPDPAYWIVVYTVVAAIPAASAIGRRLSKTAMLATGMVLSGMLVAAPGVVDYLASGDYWSITGKMMGEKAYVETAREFVGLLMAAACLWYYRKSR